MDPHSSYITSMTSARKREIPAAEMPLIKSIGEAYRQSPVIGRKFLPFACTTGTVDYDAS